MDPDNVMGASSGQPPLLVPTSMTAPSQVTGGAGADVNGTFQTTGAHAAAVMGKQAQAGMSNPMRPGGMDPAGMVPLNAATPSASLVQSQATYAGVSGTDDSGGYRPTDGQTSLGSTTTSTTLSSTMAAAPLGTTVVVENANTSGGVSSVQPPAPPSGLPPAPPSRSGSMGGSQVGKQTRELKVEDALLYLDQVKVEFADKPHVYNEFIQLMKKFKAQSIDTPGVIERVKSLFRGHNKLILGLNAFLPEGEEYKIKITAEDEAAAAQQQAAVQDPGLSAYEPQAMPQQNAISYITQIRNRFANKPETYRAFLRILHTYQKEQKGIKDVLEQVSQLFADHPDLLMGFTYFLPDAVQEQAKERLHRAAHQV